MQRLRHGKITANDITKLQQRVLSAGICTEPKWKNAVVITARNSVRCKHNEKALFALAQSLGIRPIVYLAQDTYQKEPVSKFNGLEPILAELPDSKTGYLSSKFMYLYL